MIGKDDAAIEVLDRRQLRMMVYAALMAALTAAGAWIAIPVGPVPVVLQNLFIYLAGLLLGSRWGLVSVAVYLLAGACGLPVFAGGMGGVGRIVGPTGGYLVGYLPAVFLIGLISDRWSRTLSDVLAMVAATAVIYAAGVAWLHTLTGLSWHQTLAVGMLPFLPGDAVKIAAAAAVAKALRPVIKRAEDHPSTRLAPRSG
ncbi:MAG: biotin transporter BioY [Desulfobacterales bacterium]|jgi:biotin transport system substrate-specific component